MLYASNGTILAKGFTPNTFIVTAGQTYGVLADSYGSCNFARWSDGVTSDPRSYTATGSGVTFVAVYSCTTSSVSIDSVSQNGATITGFRTVLYASNGTILAKGFTPNSFTTAVGQTYGVRTDSYQSCTFTEWSDGVTSNPRSFTATSGDVSFTAVYYCGTVSPAPVVVQSCYAYQPGEQTVTCTMSDDVQAGDLLAFQLDEVTITSFGDSMGNSFSLVTTQPLPNSTYQMYVYYAIAKSSGPDNFTLTGNGNYPSILVTEVQNAQFVSGVSANSGESGNPFVPSYTPASGSLNIVFLLAYGNGETATAGPGYALVAQTNLSVVDEYAVVNGATSPSFVLSTSDNTWTEAAVAFV